MKSNMENDLELILQHFEKFQSYQIQMCAYRHPDFKDYVIEPISDRHFKHLWNEIVKMVQGKQPFLEILSSLHDFSLFTPEYTKANLNHILLQERIEQICKTCIENNKFSEFLFHIFLQVLISQKPRKSLKMIQSVLKIYESSNVDATSLRQLSKFYTVLLNLENDSQARTLLYAIYFYLTFRDKSQFVSRLSSNQFSRLLIMIFEKLSSFPSSLFKILQYDPLIFSFLKCDECSNINISQLPPFSSILQSGEEVPKSFFMRYRQIFLDVINMFLMFSKICFTNDERTYLTTITSNVLSYVESSAVGKDAFLFVLLHFLRSDFLRKNAEYFVQYVREGEIKIEYNDKKENKNMFINIPRYNAIAIFVFSFDNDIFPSTISLICNDYCNSLITSTLKKVINYFPNSPFKEKVQTVFEKINGHPTLKKSICERATQVAYQIWKDGLVGSNKSDAINLLIDLSQKRSTTLHNDGPTIYANPQNMKYFLQLALAFFTKNKFTQSQFPFYSYIASILLPLANTNSPRKSNDHILISDDRIEEEKYNITDDDSKCPFHFYFNINGPDQNQNNIFFHLPRWHLLSIQRESIISKMIDEINFLSFLTRMNEGVTPSLFLGSLLLFSRILQKDNSLIKRSFSQFSAVNFAFLSIFFQKATLYELPEVTRELMRFMEKCPELSIDCIQSLTNCLISAGKTHGLRIFIRFLAPLFRNEQYVKQILSREYYKGITEAFLAFTEDPAVEKKEIVKSLPFIYFWRVLGTFPNMENIEPTLQKLVLVSLSEIEDNENEDLFYISLFELIVTHKTKFFLELMKNIEDFKLSTRFFEMLAKLPKKMIDEIKLGIANLIEKIPKQLIDSINELQSDNNDDISVKWVPWPIDKFIYDVSGLVC